MKQVTAIVVGAGARGTGYSNYALDFPDRLKVGSFFIYLWGQVSWADCKGVI